MARYEMRAGAERCAGDDVRAIKREGASTFRRGVERVEVVDTLKGEV